MVDLIWLIPVLPLIGAILMLLIGRQLPKIAVSVICVGSVTLSFLLSAAAALEAKGQPHEVILFTWLPTFPVSCSQKGKDIAEYPCPAVKSTTVCPSSGDSQETIQGSDNTLRETAD